MAYQPLTEDQYNNALKSGFTPDRILEMEKQRKASQTTFLQKVGGVAKTISNALSSSEQGLGNDIAAGIGGNANAKQVEKTNKATSDADLQYVNTLIQGKKNAIARGADTSHYDTALNNFQTQKGSSLTDMFPALAKTNTQVLGDIGGTALDVLSAGTYGEAAKGAETGKLLAKGGGAVETVASKIGIPTTEKVVAPIVTDVTQKTTGQIVKDIGIKTAKKAAIGATEGYGYDVSNNLQEGKTDAFTPGMGTVLGGSVPIAIGGLQAGVALSKDTAPRFINSLIKPKQADFSYGKDPGRTVSELGITGNSISDFANNIHTAKQEIGTQLGEIYASPTNANIKINAQSEIEKIDAAIQNAAKGGKENQGIVSTLQNTKDALLYEHGIDAEGNIVKMGDTPRDISALSPQEAFDLKKVVSEQTKFTGRPSDDKTVNAILKDIYSGLKEKLNTQLGKNNPEIEKLNQQYADLTSAELATRNRNAIIQRADQVSMPVKIGGVAGIISAVSTGHIGIGTLLVSAGAGALDKAMSSTAVKTRIAAWLGSQKPSAVNALISQNPEIRAVLYRVFPKIASQLDRSK